ncbi:hypothetical protein Ctha_1462 [Chloroherpeton thalassium ATCC 35110]|uniref:Lipoprotein n=1 Tax=Chloroherpeton thalassium (strain ATCC 35110 / GB-78) TaxID=517418 RepID=B3QRW8_CHLT3|nr:hypothetical protein [Chloroherpeton thalassium]ACF13921.1 hypothetical protein Ctha_1462 [Chloroherpeton thalassium ATCC 35110]
MRKLVSFSSSLLIFLVMVNVGCSSQADMAKKEIQALQSNIEQKVVQFQKGVENARGKNFSEGLDSLIQAKAQIERLQALWQAKMDSATQLFSEEERQMLKSAAENIQSLYRGSREELEKAETISRLKQKMIRLEVATADYKQFATKAAYTHFTSGMDDFSQKHHELDSLNADWKKFFEAKKSQLPEPIKTALQEKWNAIESAQSDVQDVLYVNFAKSVLYLMVTGDARAAEMLDWRNLVLDADQIGRVYSTIDYSSRDKYMSEVIQTTSGMFSYIFETSGNSVRNVRGWHLDSKQANGAVVKARSESNEGLSFTIHFSSGRLLLSRMVTG